MPIARTTGPEEKGIQMETDMSAKGSHTRQTRHTSTGGSNTGAVSIPHNTPTNTPAPPFPQPPSPACITSPTSTQHGHMTVSEHTQHCASTFNNDNECDCVPTNNTIKPHLSPHTFLSIGFGTGNPRVGKCHTVPVPAVTIPV